MSQQSQITSMRAALLDAQLLIQQMADERDTLRDEVELLTERHSALLGLTKQTMQFAKLVLEFRVSPWEED